MSEITKTQDNTVFDNLCAICLEHIDIQNCNQHMFTECGHMFHTKCFLQNSVRNGYKCPMCRTELIDLPKVFEPEQELEPIVEEDDDDNSSHSSSSSNNDYGMDFTNHTRNDAVCLSITEITNKLMENGVTMRDMVALFIGPHVNHLEDCDEFNVATMRQVNRLLEKIVTNRLEPTSDPRLNYHEPNRGRGYISDDSDSDSDDERKEESKEESKTVDHIYRK